MYDGAAVGVVVPAYNEAGFVTDVIDTIPDFVDRIVVVDDCSTDETWTEIRSFLTERAEPAVASDGTEQVSLADGSGLAHATDETGPTRSVSDAVLDHRIVPVRHGTNRGRGAAVKTGYRIALMDDLDVIAVMDGDGQMDPNVLDRIVQPVVDGEADYAKGNRLVSRDHCREMSGFRLFGNVLLTGLTKVASGHWGVRDPQNGYTAIDADALRELSLDELYDRYGFLNDVLVRLGAHDVRVVDVPMHAVYGDESSGIRYNTFVPELSFLLLRGFLWRLWVTYLADSGPGR